MAGSVVLTQQLKRSQSESFLGGADSSVHELASAERSRSPVCSERDELLSVLSHELRTPVAVVLGHLRLLLAGDAEGSTSDQRRLMKTVEEYCSRLDQFMADLIDVCHAGAMDAALDLRPRSLALVVEEARRILEPILLQNEIQLQVHIPLESVQVRFDKTRIRHVFTNLMTNAIAVTEPGGVIRIECLPVDSPAGFLVECRVIDQGPGVASAERQRIFEPFERGSSSTTAEGRGIGLALCRRIVEAHGGSIWVSDGVEKGSLFTFTLSACSSAGE